MAEKALTAVMQEAYIPCVTTRFVDDLVKAMDLSGISESQVSRLCEEINDKVKAFLDRPIEGEWSYLWEAATTNQRPPAIENVLGFRVIILCVIERGADPDAEQIEQVLNGLCENDAGEGRAP